MKTRGEYNGKLKTSSKAKKEPSNFLKRLYFPTSRALVTIVFLQKKRSTTKVRTIFFWKRRREFSCKKCLPVVMRTTIQNKSEAIKLLIGVDRHSEINRIIT